MAIEKEIWVGYILANLFKNNEFLKLAYNDDQYVVAGKLVHIPQAGAKPVVKKNRTVLPATAVKRTDTDIVYALNEYTTDPTHIPDADKVELSYDKIGNVLDEHLEAVNELIAEWMLFDWSPSLLANIVRTSGVALGAHLEDATGNRKKFVKEDLKRVQYLMNKANIAKADRYALVDSDMLSQLQDDEDLKKRDHSMELDMKNGVIDRLYGFQIIERSSVLIYNADGTPAVKSPEATSAATDNAAILCWQKNSVARALGEVNFFEDIGNPLFFGDIYSALARAGGRIRRADQAGVIAIVQDAAV